MDRIFNLKFHKNQKYFCGSYLTCKKKKTLAKESNQIIAKFFSFILQVVLLCYFMLHMPAAHPFHTSFPLFF